ncbi:MAG: TraR/DksA family transcriptional regulator [Rhodobacteraceae bacterium]|nr:TraR/DksA family transcriptional regulator [Paracoccaceae bacterium]
MITETELSAFRSQLLDFIMELEKDDVASTDNRSTVVLDQQSVGRLSRMDAMQQQAMANATHQRRLAEIARAKAALARMDQGEFGWCVDCGEDIALKRLKHDPSLPTCITCARGG